MGLPSGGESVGVARTQAQLYPQVDHALSWSEAELPERERTKHVHRLHPYLGKFVPQLVEALLERYVSPGGRVLDPFGGSGTTLVQALESGYDAVGVDVAAFNALLMRVKTADYDLGALEQEVLDARSRLGTFAREAARLHGGLVCPGSRGGAAALSSGATALQPRRCHARRAGPRGAFRATDDPFRPRLSARAPARGRTGVTSTAARAGRSRVRPGSSRAISSTRWPGSRRSPSVRDERRAAVVLHGDARELELGGPYDGVVTSPPYPGLIDYHEQHRYAYELLGLDDLREREVGAAARGTSRAAIEEYTAGIATVLRRVAESLRPGAPVCIVVNDRRALYPEILRRAGLELSDRLERHVNRRTGRRAGEYFESILIATHR